MTTSVPEIVLDDGTYYVELVTTNVASVVAPGVLRLRDAKAEDGSQTLGFFSRADHGWIASIDVQFDARTGQTHRDIGPFPERLDAVVALWRARRSV